ncbi:uncharacterized protein EI90DRAFT_3285320 [Cantharellus anzutake]|uniref:uncharacterized protein n=1 Tax=Cantharellus anzutake TaxID=1750568 RepID=UPI00190607FD|nr:uncharacterized protein EI90DRAFT_3285320 [Cantharellus anzutake]KAF8342230.1 hypothetical protein EI90DRAFT_3285320 [Cantharellus anzutake]
MFARFLLKPERSWVWRVSRESYVPDIPPIHERPYGTAACRAEFWECMPEHSPDGYGPRTICLVDELEDLRIKLNPLTDVEWGVIVSRRLADCKALEMHAGLRDSWCQLQVDEHDKELCALKQERAPICSMITHPVLLSIIDGQSKIRERLKGLGFYEEMLKDHILRMLKIRFPKDIVHAVVEFSFDRLVRVDGDPKDDDATLSLTSRFQLLASEYPRDATHIIGCGGWDSSKMTLAELEQEDIRVQCTLCPGTNGAMNDMATKYWRILPAAQKQRYILEVEIPESERVKSTFGYILHSARAWTCLLCNGLSIRRRPSGQFTLAQTARVPL